MPTVADIVFDALAAQQHGQRLAAYRLHLYLARVAIDHGQRGIAALRQGDTALAAAELRAYRRLRLALIQEGYWQPEAALQTTIPARDT